MIALDRGPRFPLGETVITPGAAAKLPLPDIESALRRHARGDWGEMDTGDKAANEAALERGSTLASIYLATNGVKFYVITEADRSTTTILLPEEY